jgi:proteasome lid subunit RPN8/RPN11
MFRFRIAVFGWVAARAIAGASESTSGPPCFEAEVVDHVREQFRAYGPRSVRHEYFGFLYVKAGIVGSAVTRSNECAGSGKCLVDTATAAKRIPQGAKVLGEWHTHPHVDGSPSLSAEDVRGANHNRHIRCYSAFYSKPNGDIYAWDPAATSVPSASASRLRLDNYNDPVAEPDTAESPAP